MRAEEVIPISGLDDGGVMDLPDGTLQFEVDETLIIG